MKKSLCLIVVFMLLLLAACEAVPAPPNPNYKPDATPVPMEVQTTEPAPVTTEVQTIEPTPSPTVATDEPDIKYAELIPDPLLVFSNGNISVTDGDGGKAYIFEVTGYADGEYESYISQCKEMGFTDVSYESSEEFGAYSEDGEYWVQLNLDEAKSIIYVICQASKHK